MVPDGTLQVPKFDNDDGLWETDFSRNKNAELKEALAYLYKVLDYTVAAILTCGMQEKSFVWRNSSFSGKYASKGLGKYRHFMKVNKTDHYQLIDDEEPRSPGNYTFSDGATFKTPKEFLEADKKTIKKKKKEPVKEKSTRVKPDDDCDSSSSGYDSSSTISEESGVKYAAAAYEAEAEAEALAEAEAEAEARAGAGTGAEGVKENQLLLPLQAGGMKGNCEKFGRERPKKLLVFSQEVRVIVYSKTELDVRPRHDLWLPNEIIMKNKREHKKEKELKLKKMRAKQRKKAKKAAAEAKSKGIDDKSDESMSISSAFENMKKQTTLQRVMKYNAQHRADIREKPLSKKTKKRSYKINEREERRSQVIN